MVHSRQLGPTSLRYSTVFVCSGVLGEADSFFPLLRETTALLSLPSSPYTTLHLYVRIYSSFLPQLLTKICRQGCQFLGTEIDSDDIVCYGCDPRGGSVTKSNVLPCSGRDCSLCIDSDSSPHVTGRVRASDIMTQGEPPT